MASGSELELTLLKKRFPEVGVHQCGRLHSDFFCARTISGCLYEGRLFVTDKALLFVSTYSTEYDLFISYNDMQEMTCVQHGFLPSLYLTLHTNKEHFTNFHNLGGLISLLKTLDITTTITTAEPPPSIQRMTSVPSTNNSSSNQTTNNSCPFYMRSGFCPRQPLCKLDHTHYLHPSQQTHTVPSQPVENVMGSPSKISLGNRSKFLPVSQSMTLSKPKRFHPMDYNKETPLVTSHDANVTMDTGPVAMTTVSMTKPKITMVTDAGASANVPEYHRSVSMPVTMVIQQQAKGSEDKKWVCSRGSSSVEISSSVTEESNQVAEKKKRVMKREEHNMMTSSGSTVEGISPLDDHRSSPVVPKVFNFYQKPPAKSPEDEGQREREEVEREGEEGIWSEGVFMFTASPSKVNESVREEGREQEEEDEEDVIVKSKPLLTSESDRKEDDSSQNEVVAELAQQLQLDSDNDSIHGDLDVDAQRKILEFLSPQQESGPSHLATGQHTSPVKRKPCVYFLSGFCRNGLSCPNYHGFDIEPSDLDDISSASMEGGDQEPVALPSEVKVYNADHTHISSGDKIILSSEVLVACEQQQLSYPVAFKLTHPSTGQSVFCGVLQFTAPTSDSAYLPHWMMDYLQANDGDIVTFSHVDLPKGTFVRLQPVSSAWLGIPYDKRMAMMEFQLRNFQTLTEGTKVTLTYELNRYTLKVLECKPEKGISILNADITTDIVEPADLSRYHSVVEGQAEHTSLGDTVHCSVLPGAYRHFVLLSLPGQPLPSSVRVEVKMKTGDPDLFLSQTCTAPSQSRYTWCSQEVGDCCINLTTDDDKDYDIEKPLYAGVVSLCEDSEFNLSFMKQPFFLTSRGIAQASGQTLRDSSHLPKTTPTSSAHTLSSSSEYTDGSSLSPSVHIDGSSLSPSVLPPGHERCSSCGSVMPALRLMMHQRHCEQSTFICPHCKAILPKSAEKKHKYIAHNLLVCACGIEQTQFALHHHQKTDCSKRMVQCQFKWCNLSFPMDQLMNHESVCGRKMITCCLCHEEVSQFEMGIHLEAFHSVDTRHIDWSKQLQKEDLLSRVLKPQLSCGCGLGFDFQDDMEVHQLTDCPLRRITEHHSISKTRGEIVG